MPDSDATKPVRLQKFLAACGVGSRRACEALIEAGRVTVNGEIAALGMSIVPTESKVYVDGARVGEESFVYVLLNKPGGVVTTADDDFGRKTVLDCVGDVGARIVPVGRLDKDVSGALLLTNDGELTYRLTHPKFEVDKIYRAKVKGAFSNAAKVQLANGVALEDGMASPAHAVLISKDRTSIVELTVHEGRNHLVKRLFEAVGHPVMKLERIRFGPLTCDGLKPGESRFLTADEVAELRKAAGLQNGT